MLSTWGEKYTWPVRKHRRQVEQTFVQEKCSPKYSEFSIWKEYRWLQNETTGGCCYCKRIWQDARHTGNRMALITRKPAFWLSPVPLMVHAAYCIGHQRQCDHIRVLWHHGKEKCQQRKRIVGFLYLLESAVPSQEQELVKTTHEMGELRLTSDFMHLEIKADKWIRMNPVPCKSHITNQTWSAA